MTFFKPRSDLIYIFISTSNVGLTDVIKVFDDNLNKIMPIKFKHPRSDDINYDEDWKKWLSFKNMMYYNFCYLYDHSSSNSHFWIRWFKDVASKLIPQDQPDQIMAAYREFGF